MGAYIIRRLIQTILVIFIVSFLAFIIIHLIPGDPIITMLGLEATQEQIDMLRGELWLDRPVMVQYFHWLGNAFQGDLGKSIMYREDVSNLIVKRLPISMYLALYAFIIATVLGVTAGIICAVRRGGILDQVITVIATLGVATPQFWIAILCVYAVGLKLGWLPIQGWTSPLDDFWLSFRKIIMPVFCLSIVAISSLARQTRSAMLEVIQQDYIRTAWAKGLRERAIILRHALKNALIPVVTILGLRIRMLFGGAVLIETVFNIPGIGRLLVRSVFDKDFVIVQACVLMFALVTCFANLAVDISYAYLDPRIRYD